MAVTLKTLAEHTGFSLATISRVLLPPCKCSAITLPFGIELMHDSVVLNIVTVKTEE